MIRRVRLARKRLMVARERDVRDNRRWLSEQGDISRSAQCDWMCYQRTLRNLRAIERRKDRIA